MRQTCAARHPSAEGPDRATQGDEPGVEKPRAGTADKDKRGKPDFLSNPKALHLTKAGSAVFDVRTLKSVVVKRERPERAAPREGDEDLWVEIASHARDAHGMDEVPPEVAETIRDVITEV